MNGFTNRGCFSNSSYLYSDLFLAFGRRGGGYVGWCMVFLKRGWINSDPIASNGIGFGSLCMCVYVCTWVCGMYRYV